MAGVPVPTAAALASPFLVLLVGVSRADQQQPAPFCSIRPSDVAVPSIWHLSEKLSGFSGDGDGGDRQR
jgi:hypothetical protein